MTDYYENLITNTKSKYYSDIIYSGSYAPKAMWNVINTERGKNNCPHVDFTDALRKSDGTQFSSKKSALNAANYRFITAAKTCGAPRADVTEVRRLLAAARAPADRCLRLRKFDVDEIYRIVLTRIPPKASRDIYGISMKLLKMTIHSLAPILVDLFNCCIVEGSFPNPLKISKVSPLYKGKGKRENIDSYRPVSIIPAVAKIFENGLSCRLLEFLSETGALSDRQYAYREGRSTTALTREVIRRVMEARESKPKLQVAILCCDLSKAFDVADRDVLAAKLQHYGVAGPAHSLLTGLTRERSQVVVSCGGSERSDSMASDMGVAQGSSVSNILFSLLLNDLPDAVTAAEVLMYADDVAAVVTAPTVDALEQKLNVAASQLYGWFHVSGLALNLTKTHFIRFSLTGRPVRPLSVDVSGVKIEEQEVTAFLGFEIDRGLKWDHHIDKVCGKLGSACFALARVARFVPTEIARSCYFATVHSQLQYGAEMWARAADWERAFRMQKRAVRSVARVSWDTPARPHFKKLGVLTLPSILIYQVAVYGRVNLSSYGERGAGHAYPTRDRHKLKTVPRSLARSDKITHVMAPTVYNSLPDDVTAAVTLQSFKRKLKKWLIEQCFYDYREFYNFEI